MKYYIPLVLAAICLIIVACINAKMGQRAWAEVDFAMSVVMIMASIFAFLGS